MKKKCEVEGCEGQVVASGARRGKHPESQRYCHKHLSRFIRNGTLEAKISFTRGTTEERWLLFLDKRGDDECWTLKKKPHESGYYRFWDGDAKQYKMAHRYSYERYVGPTNGLVVMHKCDNPSCVNPNHLRLGTQAENVYDMLDKGRGGHIYKSGAEHPKSKLDEDAVRFIRSNLSSMTINDLAEKFSVSRNCISSIKHRATWKHIE